MPDKKIILYLDDEPSSRNAIREGLGDYDIRDVGNIADFWDLLKEKKLSPDLFLIDWILDSEDERAAENLIRQLAEEYPDIPRVVLTYGQGPKGTARIIAELECGYIEKGAGFQAIAKIIKKTIEGATMAETSVEKANADKTSQKRTSEKLEKIITDLQNEISEAREKTGQIIDELERAKSDVQNQKIDVEKEKNRLQNENKELEIKRQRLDRDKFFFKRFIDTSKNIVDESLELTQFASGLVQVLVEYIDCHSGVLLLFQENRGIFVDRGISDKDATAVGTNTRINNYTVKQINVRDVGPAGQIKQLINEIGKTSSTTGADLHGKVSIITNFQISPAFQKVLLPDIKVRKNLLLVPIQMHGSLLGAILLFDKLNGQFKDSDKTEIEQLPLPDMISGASEMPFRAFDQKGKLKLLLRVSCGILSWVVPQINLQFKRPRSFSICKRNIKPWELKEAVISTYMELLRAGVSVISLLVILLPSFFIGKYFILEYIFWIKASSPHMAILSSIELLLMLLTFILFSLGLVILFEPTYARGLPRWMLNFTRISTLEGTILKLVVIILAVHVLGRFLLSDDKDNNYTVGELFVVSISICFIIAAVGVFTKYFLHEEVEKEERDA